ncbi:hypothetical protein JTB14_001835 [Gonioctena quinquepunctata]|nr:hypothetical protein JTB14_001835 [Gonioctena quinquepunctata]
MTMNEWMCTPGNAGKPITIYDVYEIAGKAYELAFTPKNIVSGFEISGIIPLNDNILDELFSANVTDRSLSSTNNGIEHDVSLLSTSTGSVTCVETLGTTTTSSDNNEEPSKINNPISAESPDKLRRPYTPVHSNEITPGHSLKPERGKWVTTEKKDNSSYLLTRQLRKTSNARQTKRRRRIKKTSRNQKKGKSCPESC